MNRNLKKALGYVLIPCLFTVLCYGVYLLAGTSVANYISAQIYAAVEKGNPEYRFVLADAVQNGAQDTRETVKQSEINSPSIGEQYGIISCEDIDLKAPLYFGDSDEILAIGAGQYVKSSLPGFGGCILVGGHDSTFFGSLDKMEAGQQIVLQTGYGTYIYAVSETKIAKTEDVSACRLDSKTEQLVLYTCYPFGELLRARDERFFVYCDKISGPSVEED